MFYKVVAKCGHVGKRKYIEVAFGVKFNSKKEAARYILSHGKVKKQLKDAISYVEEISYDEYVELLKSNENNAYIRSHYKKERTIDDDSILELKDKKRYKKESEFETRDERINYLLRRDYLRGARYYDFNF